jgi:hypothetical protein
MKQKKVSTIIKILLVIILVGANGFLLFTFLNKNHKAEDKTDSIEVTSEKQEEKELNTTWLANNKKYVFQSDGTFEYHDNVTDYYSGTYTYLKGDKALEEMGYTEESLSEQFGEGINKENVYSMQLSPTKRMINEEDKSSIIKENTKWWFILIVKEEDEAIGYNKTLDERYDLFIAAE